MRLLDLAITLGLFLAPGLQGGSPWPKLQANSVNSGNGTGGGSNGVLRWSVPVPIANGSSPAIAADGTIYLASSGALAALRPTDGSLKWTFPTGSLPGVIASPAIGSDGTVYVTGDGAPLLLAVASDGKLTWQFSGLADGGIYQPTAAPTIAPDGTIYIPAEEFQTATGAGVNQNYLFALNPDGSVKWEFHSGLSNVIGSMPAIGADGTLYFGSYTQAITGTVYAVNPQTGNLQWSFTTTGQIVSSPAIGPDGTIFVGEQGGTRNLYAVNSDGVPVRSAFSGTGSIVSTPAVAADGSVYFPESDGSYYALNPNGTSKWSLPQGTCTAEATVIGSDGILYYGTRDGHLTSAFQQGTAIWSFAGAGAVASSKAIAADGTLYFGDSTGALVALGAEVDTIPVAGLTLNPTSVVGGVVSMAQVTIQSAAPKGSALVHLASSDPTVTTPPFTEVPEGATQSSFYIGTVASSNPIAATITASSGGASRSAILTVEGATLVNISVSPTSVIGGSQSIGSVTLTAPAPAGGVSILLTSSSTIISLPPTLQVPEASVAANFTIMTSPVGSKTVCTISASQGGVKVGTSLTVNPPALIRLIVAPTSVLGGRISIGNVAISSTAPVGGVVVQLASSNPSAASTPASVTISAGINAAVFRVTSFPVSSQTAVKITGTVGASTKSATLTVKPAGLANLTISPSKVKGGSTATGTITLGGPAPSSGALIALTTNSDSATVPQSVTVAAGQTRATFPITTRKASTQTTVTVTATLGVTKTAILTVST